MSRVYEHTGVVWSVTSAAVHLQRYIRVIRCISVCICRAMRCIISFRVFFGRPMHNSELAIAPPQERGGTHGGTADRGGQGAAGG
jgi:hypothetical protein